MEVASFIVVSEGYFATIFSTEVSRLSTLDLEYEGSRFVRNVRNTAHF